MFEKPKRQFWMLLGMLLTRQLPRRRTLFALGLPLALGLLMGIASLDLPRSTAIVAAFWSAT